MGQKELSPAFLCHGEGVVLIGVQQFVPSQPFEDTYSGVD
jgi:hypothetical protein